MLTVSPAALDQLSQKLTDKNVPAGSALRFSRKPGGWKLHADATRPMDTLIAHKGKTVLMLDREASAGLAAKSLVVATTDEGPKLRLVTAEGEEQ